MGVLTVKKENFIAVVTLENPPANALANKVLKELTSLLDELENDKETRVILLKGEGRFFSAGADIKEFTQVENTGGFSDLSVYGQKVFERMEGFPKPVIAAIHGAALGGGLELAMSCHIRLVTETAKLGLPELQLGIIPGFGGSQRLPDLVGKAKAFEMMATSEPITGKEAAALGLANAAYPEEELFAKAEELAGKIAKKSPASIKAVIDLLQFRKNRTFQESIEEEAEQFGKIFGTNDAKEGIQAFIEKREPDFKGE
ncbi:enoyl-CoA hydratase [Metabacillus sp. GX 13764]|uniref:enoyl-CoA hydratase n=1 Tax=Metabacillus kandeliae TaxID=2900151 RepID=UPI001E3CE95B|nr:enoyl-CoA hydratase [Metabacillus kandeliae]MCD7032839.1 enoyl-CoA hydratase [Metabacillus kandeliae]